MTKLDFSRTLDKAVVHKVAIAEVFLTDATRVSGDEYHIGVQVPRHHGMFGDLRDTAGRYDPMFFLEACRQGVYVVAHMFHGVPMDRHFILREATLRVVEPELLAIAETPTEAVVRVHVLRRIHKEDALVGLRLGYRVLIDGQVAIESEISASWITPAEHEILRTGSRDSLGLGDTPTACPLPPRAPAKLVNRRLPLNVVISQPLRDEQGGQRAVLIADTTHPSLFDHPLDHLPGMLELEACRQLTLAALGQGWQLDELTAKFRAFAEFDLPAHCVTDLPVSRDGDGEGVRVPVRVVQAGRTVLEVELGLAHVPITSTGFAPMALVASA